MKRGSVVNRGSSARRAPAVTRERILGIPYHPVGTEEALARVESFLNEDRQHVVIHLGLATLMAARRRQFLRTLLEEADLILPSGKYVCWAARVLGRPLRETADPSVFVKLLMNQAVELNRSVYLLGGRGRTIELAYQNLKRENPRLFVVGRHREDYDRLEHDKIVQAIGKASPDYLFIGKGTPHAEYWYLNNHDKLNARITVFVGRLFDVLAGRLSGSYRHGLTGIGEKRREMPHPGAARRLWWVPAFISMVLFNRLFSKRT